MKIKNKMPQGVIVMITNKGRDKFYCQQKDETYPIKPYRLKYCFFGGGIESEEKAEKALERELIEELDYRAASIIFNNSKKILQKNVVNVLGDIWEHFIFESTLSDKELEYIAKFYVKEGKQGKIFQKKELIEEDFFPENWKILNLLNIVS